MEWHYRKKKQAMALSQNEWNVIFTESIKQHFQRTCGIILASNDILTECIKKHCHRKHEKSVAKCMERHCHSKLKKALSIIFISDRGHWSKNNLKTNKG